MALFHAMYQASSILQTSLVLCWGTHHIGCCCWMGMTTIVKFRSSSHRRGGPVGVRGVAAWLGHWQLRHRGPDTHVLLRHGVLGWPRHFHQNCLIGIPDFRTRSQSSVQVLPRATLCLDHLGFVFLGNVSSCTSWEVQTRCQSIWHCPGTAEEMSAKENPK